MSRMIRHCGSTLVEPAQLAAITTPAPMGPRHAPIAHSDVRSAIVGCLNVAGYDVVGETLAVAGPEQEDLFGLMQLGPRAIEESDTVDPSTAILRGLMGSCTDLATAGEQRGGWMVHEAYGPAVAYRHSNRQRFSFMAMFGLNVTVCDNLMVAGGEELARKKHTKNLNLYATMADCMRRLAMRMQHTDATVQRLQALELEDVTARARMHTLFAAGALPVQYLKPMARAYFEPEADWTDCQGRTEWSLYNAATRSIREEPLHTKLAHTASLLPHFPAFDARPAAVIVEDGTIDG